MTVLSAADLRKSYGSGENTVHALDGIDLTVERGEFAAVVGTSGSGKSTLLHMLGGLDRPTSGKVEVDGKDIFSLSDEELTIFRRRKIGFVFQNYALFPNMNVYDNVAYGLKVKKVPKDEIKKRVKEMLKLVQLEGFEKRRINQMSGGQKQRVAIARALINKPKVLLLDEPLGALDLKLRKQMQIELKRLQKKLSITFVYVTHDQEEALTMSDRIAIINKGVIEQIDTAYNIYEHPKTRFVAGFIGESNILNAVVLDNKDGVVTIGTEVGKAMALAADKDFQVNDSVSISIRPENMLYSKEPVEGFGLKAVVKEHIYVGNIIKTILLLNDGTEIKVNRFSEDDAPDVGDMVYLYWKLEKGILLKDKKTVDTDSVRDIEGGSADDEE